MRTGLQGASVVRNILMIEPREMIQFDYYFNQVGWESQTSSVFFILKKMCFSAFDRPVYPSFFSVLVVMMMTMTITRTMTMAMTMT